MNIDDFVPPGFIRLSVVECVDCDIQYVTMDGTDNVYDCRDCKKSLMDEEEIQYDVPEKDLAEFMKKNYKGLNLGSRS